jgi:hypothetical protein
MSYVNVYVHEHGRATIINAINDAPCGRSLSRRRLCATGKILTESMGGKGSVFQGLKILKQSLRQSG